LGNSVNRIRPTVVQVRLVAGLILGAYVTLHLSNHALGLISVRAQEAARPWVMAFWHSEVRFRAHFAHDASPVIFTSSAKEEEAMRHEHTRENKPREVFMRTLLIFQS